MEDCDDEIIAAHALLALRNYRRPQIAKRTGKRGTFSQAVKMTMYKLYRIQKKPSREDRDRISYVTGLNDIQITDWFANARRRNYNPDRWV